MSLTLPAKAGTYSVQLTAPRSRETFIVNVTLECQEHQLGPKPSNLGGILTVNDNQNVAYTNAQKFDREDFEKELRATLSRPLGPSDGYSNLHEITRGVPRDPALEAASRAAAARLKAERGF